MKICITSKGETLESEVDPRFGRCSFFIIIDPDTLDYEVIDNSNAGSSGGAGIQSGQLISEKGVKALLTGNVGPNAFQVLNEAKIDIYIDISGTIKEAVAKYINDEIKAISEPSVGSHFGMK